MPRTSARFASLLAFALAASGCATTHLAGEYRPYSEPSKTAEGDKDKIGEHSKWLFLWGLIDTRDYHTGSDFERSVKEGYIVRDVEIKDRESVLGVLLWIITAGTVNHHTVIIKGRPIAPEGALPPETPAEMPSR